LKRLVKFPLADGNVVVVEVDEPETSGTVRASRSDDMVDEAKQTFEQSLDTIRTSTESVINKLQSLTHRPDEIEMEFGFNMSGEFGAVIAKVTAEANYKVTLRWQPVKQ
jgi:Trypsin-co-occurring domain 1